MDGDNKVNMFISGKWQKLKTIGLFNFNLKLNVGIADVYKWQSLLWACVKVTREVEHAGLYYRRQAGGYKCVHIYIYEYGLTLLLNQRIFKLQNHIGMVWEELVFDLVCLFLFYTVATVFQLLYDAWDEKEKAWAYKFYWLEGLILPHHVGRVWEQLASDDTVR